MNFVALRMLTGHSCGLFRNRKAGTWEQKKYNQLCF